MSVWRNFSVTKCPRNEMYVKKCPVTKCPCDKISYWQNVRWRNVRVTECPRDEMSVWQNVLWPNFLVTKCVCDQMVMTKWPVTKCPVTKCRPVGPSTRHSRLSAIHFSIIQNYKFLQVFNFAEEFLWCVIIREKKTYLCYFSLFFVNFPTHVGYLTWFWKMCDFARTIFANEQVIESKETVHTT